MSDKFQVLTSVDGRTSLVIEQNGEPETRPKWKVVVPDAGTPSTAAKIARLFNKEHDEYIRVRAAREAVGGAEDG
jgi:hypothetical protein